MQQIQVFGDLESLSRAASQLFLMESRQAIAARGRFRVVLAGGSTPRRTYELLAGRPWCQQVEWSQVDVFWGDERCVPPEDPRSNWRMAREALLDHVPLGTSQIHPIDGSLPPPLAAERYEQSLREAFGGQPPSFDLVLLGLGENAHTASLFPDTAALSENHRWVVEVPLSEQELSRITLTAPLLNQAQTVAFLVAGSQKASAVQAVLEGPRDANRYPAQLIQPRSGRLLWLLDTQAAARLSLAK